MGSVTGIIQPDLAFLLDRCESPIERTMAMSLYGRAEDNGDLIRVESPASVFVKLPTKVPLDKPAACGISFIWSQYPLNRTVNGKQAKPYRLDFMVGRFLSVRTPSSEPLTHLAVRSPLVVVECDGHDYHERTKEQAARDRSRDRAMLINGFRVVRFTGSEIFANPGGCADFVWALLNRLSDPNATPLHA